MMIGRRWLLALTVMMSLSGCGTGSADEGAGVPYRPPTLPELRDQARAALARYDEAVGEAEGTRRFVPVGALTAIVGDLEPENGDLKEAVAAGLLLPAGALPVAPRRSGTIMWADGASREASVISAEAALAAHRQGGGDGCDGCAPLAVTGARLVTMQVHTTTGEAAVPAWEYALKGTALRVRYAAISGSDVVTLTSPPWDPTNPPGGQAIEAATTAKNSKHMTVSFTGAQGPASEPCGEDYHVEAIESDNAVIVILVTEPRPGDDGLFCTLMGYRRTETVPLARPLGDRAVLEGQQGTPVTVTVTN
jgi:hypothetical protein